MGEQTSKIIVYQFCTDNPLVKHAQLVIIHVNALYIEESRTAICPPFCGTANEHCLILWSVRSLYHTGFFRTFYMHNGETEKNCFHGNTSCLILLKKLTSSYSCRGLECKKSTGIKVKETEKKVLPWQHWLPGLPKK